MIMIEDIWLGKGKQVMKINKVHEQRWVKTQRAQGHMSEFVNNVN